MRFQTIAVSLLACSCVYGIFLLRRDGNPLPGSQTANTVVFRPRPLGVRCHKDYAHLVPQVPLEKTLEILEPYWDYRRASDISHALRLWGGVAQFPSKSAHAMPPTVVPLHGEAMLGFFLREKGYRESYRDAKAMFYTTPLGVGARKDDDASALLHHDDFLSVAAEVGLPLETALSWSGQEFQLKDLFAHSFNWYSPSQELEFTATAYVLWLAPKSKWRNRFGEEYSFDALAQHLMNKDMAKCACFGTHIPYTLALLLNVDERESILSPPVREKVEERLKKISAVLASSQGAAGWWDRNWGQPNVPPVTGEDEKIEWLRATGHHLEWIAIAPAACRPPDRIIEKAIALVLKMMPTVNTGLLSTASHYPLYSHIGRALVLLAGYQYAPEPMQENWKARP